MNRCRAFRPSPEVFIQVQTMEIQPSIDTEDTQTSDIVSEVVSETDSGETLVQEDLQTVPLRRSNRDRKCSPKVQG